ncbi:MAG: flavin monoamine oxidase family protein [Aestuariivirga sp.]
MNSSGTAPSSDSSVIIVGAGIAGLYAARKLGQANVPHLVLEADDHAGGRVFSRQERQSHLGLTIDEGANLINSTDTLAIGLMNQFGIRYVRRLKPGTDNMHYLVNGEEYAQADFDRLLFRESREALNTIQRDQEVWNTDARRATNPAYIDQSIADYLAAISSGPVLRTMLKSFFWSEYGREIENLNLHVFFEYVEIDLNCPCFRLIPNVDEAYTVPGGLGQIAARLERDNHDRVRYGRRVESIIENGNRIGITARLRGGAVETYSARHVFFAAPLHSLPKIRVEVEGLSAHAIGNAGIATYAHGTKLHLKFLEGFHKAYRFSGILLSDTGEQIWPSSTGQGGAGLLTVLTGPLPPGRAHAVAHAGRVLLALDRVCPGLSELYVGVERSDAPASYSGSLRPGEPACLAIHDGGAHWTTIGEASHPELQGYVEGALRSADDGVTRYLMLRRQAKRGKMPR